MRSVKDLGIGSCSSMVRAPTLCTCTLSAEGLGAIPGCGHTFLLLVTRAGQPGSLAPINRKQSAKDLVQLHLTVGTNLNLFNFCSFL